MAYAEEYSPQEIAARSQGFQQLLQPGLEQGARKLRSSLAGTGGLSGSPLQYGLGDLYQQNATQVGQFNQDLMNKAIEARRGERLTAENWAHEDPYRMAPLTGKFQGNETQQAQAQRFGQGVTTGELTGNYGGARTLGGTQQDINKRIAEANMSGMYSDGTGGVGKPTLNAMLSMAPLATEGYFGKSGLSPMYTGGLQGVWGNFDPQGFQDEASINAQKMGYANANAAAQAARNDPEGYEALRKQYLGASGTVS